MVPVLHRSPRYIEEAKILERLAEPDRVISFGVNWVDDRGEIHVNRGYRVQMSSSIGPYKGGLRFHPTVNEGLFKFLAFEQTLKDSLTTLPMGGAKGGSDFDPKGKSEAEIRRFCQSFMTELYPYIGEFTDVPAGDIGVGEREIGYLFGQYKRITKRFVGVLTGKGTELGGSAIRQEATGYGLVYFAREMLAHTRRRAGGQDLSCLGERQCGAVHGREAPRPRRPTSAPCRTPTGSCTILTGSTGEARVGQGAEERAAWPDPRVRRHFPSALYAPAVPGGENPLWTVPADCAFPCATQNEIGADGCRQPDRRGASGWWRRVPTCRRYPGRSDQFVAAGILYGPAKAANAGGVAVSGLEMAQNMQLTQWPPEEVDGRLQAIMLISTTPVLQTAAEDYGSPR